MPETAPVGPATLVVTSAGSASKPFSIEIADSNPGIFSQNKNGWGPGEIDNFDSLTKRTLNSPANPATPGQKVAMKITGLGKGTAAIVVVGNRTVNAGLARAMPQSGEQEISFAIPQDAPLGCYVPVYLQASPTRASNVVTMSIRSGSAKCDPGPIPTLDAKRIAMIAISRTNMFQHSGNTDKGEVRATFAVRDQSLSPLLLLPPPAPVPRTPALSSRPPTRRSPRRPLSTDSSEARGWQRARNSPSAAIIGAVPFPGIATRSVIIAARCPRGSSTPVNFF